MADAVETTERTRMRADVAEGLKRAQKELSPKYFYDRRGSELFEEITRLPEYYPTRAERGLLTRFVPGWIDRLRPVSLVELGAGAADKTRILLSAMRGVSPTAMYVPVDISADFLESAAEALRSDYPELTIEPVAADISASLGVPAELPRPAVFAILGGTIGNFREPAAIRLLGRIAAAMEPGDHLLMGADLEKELDVLERAYNDAAGVTAEFNLNVLRVLNRELGADFDLESFRHRAFYNRDAHRIEMHLVAVKPATVSIPGAGTFHWEEGETVRTEVSYKYDRDRVAELLRAAGLRLDEWITGEDGFSLSVARLP